MDSTLVIYTGLPLPYIVVNPGDDLQTILASIDTAVNAMNPAPDYTPYNLQCLRPTYTITDTQEFAEAVADFICLLRGDYDTFTSTTYVADMAAIQATLDSLTDPGLTYAPYGIINTDDIATVYAKLFNGLTALEAMANPAAADWAAIGAGIQTSTADGFDTLILYGLSLAAAIATKEDAMGPFDNSANCLSGGATDSAEDTINLLRTYICTLPTFDPGNITWGCIAPGSDLETSIDNIIATLGGVMGSYVDTPGTGLVASAPITCVGKTLDIDTTWEGLYKVAIDLNDATLGNADFLGDKVTSLDGSVTIDLLTNPDKLDLSVTTPVDQRTKVNSLDPTPGFLADKIPNSGGDWGLAITTQANYDNTKLLIIPTVNNADVLINNLLDAIQSDPDLLAKFCATVDMCGGCLCVAVGDLIVTLVAGEFELNWTPAGGTTTAQVAKYRPIGLATWLTGNFSPANILGPLVATTTTVGLNVNQLYEFQVDSNCPGDVAHSNIYEMVEYDQQVVTPTVVGTDVNVAQPPMTSINDVQYELYDQNLSLVDTKVATGTSPTATFTSVPIGNNYTVKYRQGTLVNGVQLWSDDATQSVVWYTTSPFNV